jgi:hypothetical protein
MSLVRLRFRGHSTEKNSVIAGNLWFCGRKRAIGQTVWSAI